MSDERPISEQQERAASRQLLDERKQSALVVEDVADMVARVEDMGPADFLVTPLWPSDAYGVLAAQDKAGKTWAAVDLAVSVATGGQWLGAFDCKQGRVLMYCGEGGARNIVRRICAVAEHKDVQVSLLHGHLRIGERAPELRVKEALAQVHEELTVFPSALVIIDPLYLAAIGGQGSDLYAMGGLLTDVQMICQNAGAALAFTHHWNKTGEGKGAKRMTGVGPGAWGRVLGSGSVEGDTRDGHKSVVTVRWEFTGSEIPSTVHTVERSVWTDDSDDLNSRMHYEVRTLGNFEGLGDDGERHRQRVDKAKVGVLRELEFAEEVRKPDMRKLIGCRNEDLNDALDELRREGRVSLGVGERRAVMVRRPVPEQHS